MITNISTNLYGTNVQSPNNRIAFKGTSDAILSDKFELNTNPQIKDETLQKLQKLKGFPAANTNRIIKILMEDKGLDASLVPVKDTTFTCIAESLKSQSLGVAGIHRSTGELMIAKPFASYMTNGQYAALIAHELDHFVNLAKLCQSIGIDEYGKLFKNTAEPFNREVWQKASEAVDIKGFEPKPILDSMCHPNQNPKFGASGALDQMLYYLTSPLEQSAYALQYHIEDKLSQKPGLTTHRGQVKLIQEIDRAFENAAIKNPAISDFKGELVDLLYEDSLRFIHKPIEKVNQKMSQCVQNGEPVDKYIPAYERAIKEAALKMNSLHISNIFNPEKCLEKERTVLKRIAFMLESAPLENYLVVATQKRLANIKAINQEHLSTEDKEAVEQEIKKLEAKMEKLKTASDSMPTSQ